MKESHNVFKLRVILGIIFLIAAVVIGIYVKRPYTWLIPIGSILVIATLILGIFDFKKHTQRAIYVGLPLLSIILGMFIGESRSYFDRNKRYNEKQNLIEQLEIYREEHGTYPKSLNSFLLDIDARNVNYKFDSLNEEFVLQYFDENSDTIRYISNTKSWILVD